MDLIERLREVLKRVKPTRVIDEDGDSIWLLHDRTTRTKHYISDELMSELEETE